MKTGIALCLPIAFLLMLISTQACGHSQPLQLPRAVSAERLHQWLAEEHTKNPTRLQERVGNREVFRIFLRITTIEEDKVQQIIKEHVGGFDAFVECELKERRLVLPLNVGDTIQVYGFLEEAFATIVGMQKRAVKLRDCDFVSET